MSTLVKVLIGLAALALVWWAIASIGPSDAEEVAVAKEQARVAAESARRDSAKVASMEKELALARLETGRVDTIIRTVLRTPPPVRPVTPTGPGLDSLGSDSLKALVGVLEAYSDTVTKENVVLRATLDTAFAVFGRYRLAADTSLTAQARQIVAQRNQIAALNVIIDVRECRVLGLLKCPSRKVALIGGAVLGAVAVGYVKR